MPGHAALLFEGEATSYRDLDARVRCTAAALPERGVGPGDRVAVLSENSPALVEAIHAVPRAGAILVPLNARLAPPELAWQLRNCSPTLLLCSAALEAPAREAASASGLPAPVPLGTLASTGKVELVDAHPPGAVHSIIYTSGTTGRPKGAMLTFANFWASAAASAFNLGVQPGDRWLACLPLFHVGGLSIALRSAIYGTTMLLHPRFDEQAANHALRGEGATLASLVATMLQRMLDADDLPYPASVRAVLAGGGPVPLPILERALARGLPVVQTYGLTEAASQVATLAPADAVRHAGSAGQPLVATGLRVDAPPGEPGEILVSGPTVTPGYWGDPAATAAALVDGWFRTGDVGRLDPDGYLYVLDRREDLIVSGGENVYPAEVEAVLLGYPGIRQAAVVGLPDARWGQVVAAAVVAEPGFDAAALDSWLRSRLAGYKVPRVIRCVESLPMTASGKAQRRLVRELLTNAIPPTPSV
jgi:O-succinylbenzoic acid--CoA ligase